MPALAAFGRLARSAGYLLFFMMLFVPTTYQPIKAVLLAFVLVSILVAAVASGRFPLHRHVALISLGYAALGALSVLRGHAGGAPGAVAMFNPYVTWPLVFSVLVAGTAHQGVLTGLLRVLVCSALAISIYSITYVLWAAGYWPDALYYPIDQGQAIGFHGTYVEFNLYSIASLLFLVPFLVGALLMFPASQTPIGRRTLWCALLLSLATVLLSGRRALLVLVPIAPVLALAFRSWLRQFTPAEDRRSVFRTLCVAGALTLILGLMVVSMGGLAPRGFVHMVATGFQFGTDPVAMLRRDQFAALIEGWLENPLIGSGQGAPAPGYIRSVATPWAYELSYISLLYHTGAIGVLLYAAGPLWIALHSRAAARAGWHGAPYALAVMVGSASFLIANATNPYLEKYDYLWVVFLPVAFVNAWLVDQSRSAR